MFKIVQIQNGIQNTLYCTSEIGIVQYIANTSVVAERKY